MAKKPDHLHKYKKMNISRRPLDEYWVYRCMLPTCNHYVPIKLAEGKLCECNRCHELMVITKRTLVHSGGKPMLFPHCENCIERKKPADVHAIAAYLEGNISHKSSSKEKKD